MPEEAYQQVLLKDPLSEVTRKERRNLLAVSALGIIMVKTGLLPAKISALGIEFSQTDKKALLQILTAITVYFLGAFLFYALSDFYNYKFAFYDARIKSMSNKADAYKALAIEIEDIRKQVNLLAEEKKRYDDEVVELKKMAKDKSSNIAKEVDDLKKSIDDKVQIDVEFHKKRIRAEADKTIALLKERQQELSEKKQALLGGLKPIGAIIDLGKVKAELSDIQAFSRSAKFIGGLRLVFELLIPLGVSIYAIFILVKPQ